MSSIFDRENYVTFWEVCTFRTMIRKSILLKKAICYVLQFYYLFSFACHV